MSRYGADESDAVSPRALDVGQRVKLDGDRRWWTVRAVTENFAALRTWADRIEAVQ